MNLGVVPIVNARVPYLNGFVISNNGVSQQLISDGVCSNSTNEVDIYVDTGGVGTVLDYSFNGINGLDTGVFSANSIYAIYAVSDITGSNKSGFIASLNFNTAPFMPTGYSAYRRIGYSLTNSSSQLRSYYAYGNGTQKYYQFFGLVGFTGLNETSFTTLDMNFNTSGLALLAPVQSQIVLQATYLPATAGNKFYLRQTLSAGALSSASYNEIGISTTIATTREITFPVQLTNNGVPRLDYAVTESGDSLDLLVIGFTDYL